MTPYTPSLQLERLSLFIPIRSVCTFKDTENVPQAKTELSEQSEFSVFNSQYPVSQKKVLQAK